MRIVDLALAVGASARLSRLVITDDLGKWWIREPVDRAMDEYAAGELLEADQQGREPQEPWWWKYRSGLDCPFCVGFWLGAAVLVAHRVLPAPVWRFGVSALALNYVASHIGSRLGDFDEED